jgi:MraZ protein
VFSGEYYHILDIKYRYIVPAVWREELGDSFMVTKGLDSCLFVYAQEIWQQKAAELSQLSSTSATARRFSRYFFSGALTALPDKQGRVVLPESLRNHAKLEREIVTIGVQDRLEIWDKNIWQAYNGESAMKYEEASENLAESHPEIHL